MRNLLGYAAVAFVLFWVLHDPTGAANTVAHVAHALGVAAGTLTHQLSAAKPALTGESAVISTGQGSA